MKIYHAIFFLLCTVVPASAQHVFSERDFEYKKTLLPYDKSYIIPLPEKQHVLLRQEKKNRMVLSRYDQYFFSQWEHEIEFDKAKSAPQIFHKGDSLVTCSFTIDPKDNLVYLDLRYFSLGSGLQIGETSYEINSKVDPARQPGLTVSSDYSHFALYNLLDEEGKWKYLIYELGSESAKAEYTLDHTLIPEDAHTGVHLSNDGDWMLAAAHAVEFNIDVYFWEEHNGSFNHLENNFFWERPPQEIGEMEIIRQSASSYFIAFSGRIEDELIGYSALGINVVLNTVLFSYNQNFNSQEINALYEDFYITSERQRKRRLRVPEILEDFRLEGSLQSTDNDIILAFEELETTVAFHDKHVEGNFPWKSKTNEDKFYFGGDLILYCFDASGQIKWRKVIQKSQFSQGNSLGLSFIPRITDDELDLLVFESSRDGNAYIFKLNISTGDLAEKINLLPDDKWEFAKTYSCWLDPNSVLLFGIKPANSRKKSLMLVEF
jgi:hypothetical protein